jgi:AcrR family transcriptional regulator
LRMEQLLDAAELVIAEVGVEGASVQAIAHRAGASMGSLYHFFPGKDALVLALADRCMQRVTDVNRQAVSPDVVTMPLERVFERVVMGQVELMAQIPAFDALHDAALKLPAGQAIAHRMEHVLVEQVESFLQHRYPRMPEPKRRAAARYSVFTVHAVMDAAPTASADEQHALLAELQTAMVRYFTPYEVEYRGEG